MLAEWLASITDKATAYIVAHAYKWLTALAILVSGYVIIKVIDRYVGKFFDRVDFERTLEVFVQKTIKIALWIILVVLVLANLGVDVSALIAGLGIAGFVIGFATKDALSNLAAGMFLLVKKPFKVGEMIEVSKVKGKVREMGIATTILVNDENHFITVPNAKIWGNPITNYSRLEKKPRKK